MREFQTTVERYQAAAGDAFDFGPTRAAIEDLDASLTRFYTTALANVAPGSAEARRFNAAQRRLARLLVPVNYSRVTPFHHDPAMEVPPLPDLAPALMLANSREDVAQRNIVTHASDTRTESPRLGTGAGPGCSRDRYHVRVETIVPGLGMVLQR